MTWAVSGSGHVCLQTCQQSPAHRCKPGLIETQHNVLSILAVKVDWIEKIFYRIIKTLHLFIRLNQHLGHLIFLCEFVIFPLLKVAFISFNSLIHKLLLRNIETISRRNGIQMPSRQFSQRGNTYLINSFAYCSTEFSISLKLVTIFNCSSNQRLSSANQRHWSKRIKMGRKNWSMDTMWYWKTRFFFPKAVGR